MYKKSCFNCGRVFYPSRSNQMYCCKRCRELSYRKETAPILPIKKKWFDRILSGEKREDYRVRKPYWEKRFQEYFGYAYGPVNGRGSEFAWQYHTRPKEVIFRNGYGKNAPEFRAMVVLREKEGRPEWGAEPGVVYFVLEIQYLFDIKTGDDEQ